MTDDPALTPPPGFEVGLDPRQYISTDGARCIYEVNGKYVISENQTWLPGNYSDLNAAVYAFQLTDKQLSELERRLNHGEQRPVTYEDLEEARND